MGEEYQQGITELRINSKAAISGINSLAKRLEESNIKIADHERAIAVLVQKVEDLTYKTMMLNAKLHEAGVR